MIQGSVSTSERLKIDCAFKVDILVGYSSCDFCWLNQECVSCMILENPFRIFRDTYEIKDDLGHTKKKATGDIDSRVGVGRREGKREGETALRRRPTELLAWDILFCPPALR